MGTTTPPGTPDFPITEDAGVTDTESILTIPLTALELGAGSAFGVSSNSKIAWLSISTTLLTELDHQLIP